MLGTRTWESKMVGGLSYDGTPKKFLKAIFRDLGFDIGEDGGIAASSCSTDVTRNVTPAVSASTPTSHGHDVTPQQQQPNDEMMRATFNSIEYSEAEIPNIIPKSTERLPRR